MTTVYLSKTGVMYNGYYPDPINCIALTEEQYAEYLLYAPYAVPVYSTDRTELLGFSDGRADFPPPPLTPDQERDLLLAQLQEDNKLLRAQLTASIQSNQTLEDCIVEMASVVYA